MKHIAAPFTLPNGAVLKNRIAKSAMSETLCTSAVFFKYGFPL